MTTEQQVAALKRREAQLEELASEARQGLIRIEKQREAVRVEREAAEARLTAEKEARCERS